MFTAVYLCYSPASQLWLAPFTRPQLQLQLNKTSNRDTKPFCPSFSPPPLKIILHRTMGEKKKNNMLKMLSLTSFFPVLLPISSQFLFPISTSLSFQSDTVEDTLIYPPTRTSYPCKEATLRVFLLLSLRFCHYFCRKTVLFMSWRPVAVCELKVVVWGLGLDHIWLKNIELFAFFSTLTMKQW